MTDASNTVRVGYQGTAGAYSELAAKRHFAGRDVAPVGYQSFREMLEALRAEEVAYAPIYHYTIVQTVKPWLTRNFPPVGGNDFFAWTIDQAAQMEALGQ